MSDFKPSSSASGTGISLVDGDPAVRHARQLMLRSQDYEVRSYATCAALLADPRSRNYPCIILDLEMEHIDGVDLLRQMRGTGWRGKALLLDGLAPGDPLLKEAERNGDTVLSRGVGDQTLLRAVAGAIDRSWSGWNPLD